MYKIFKTTVFLGLFFSNYSFAEILELHAAEDEHNVVGGQIDSSCCVAHKPNNEDGEITYQEGTLVPQYILDKKVRGI
ncbi:MAG: hypothetical protein QE271_00685 [Bacteriovoracaceae bacterium]|nr:hypothetical protein [Bacteriovoracaceae bacterium]